MALPLRRRLDQTGAPRRQPRGRAAGGPAARVVLKTGDGSASATRAWWPVAGESELGSAPASAQLGRGVPPAPPKAARSSAPEPTRLPGAWAKVYTERLAPYKKPSGYTLRPAMAL